MTWRLLSADPNGLRRYGRPDGNGGLELKVEQDTTAAIDAAKAMNTHNDGYNAARDIRRAAHIPDIIILKWKNEEGLDIYNPAHADRLVKKLNDPDWAYLRTAPGRIGYSNGVMR